MVPDSTTHGEEGTASRPGPLGDVRVLDLSLLFPGPYCAQILGDLGADVISVEPPRGDLTRTMPSRVHPVINRNKRGVVLDLKTKAGRRACLRVAAGVDVVIEGFRPGVVDRLGVGYEDVRAGNPGVVYCSISGFGQTGPDRLRSGHDLTYLCASGALSFPGHWLEPPRRQGVPMGDAATATFASIAILSALHERDATGEGAHLDIAITDAAMAFAAFRGGPALDLPPEQRLHLWPVNELFTAADGVGIAIAAVEEHFWQGLRRCVAEYDPAILEPRFGDEAGRRAHGDELKRLLDGVFARRPAAEWVEELARHDVPAQRVLTLPEAADRPQMRHRGLVAEVDGQRLVGFPVLSGGRPMGAVTRTAPALGAHTREVLEEHAVDPADIETLTTFEERH